MEFKDFDLQSIQINSFSENDTFVLLCAIYWVSNFNRKKGCRANSVVKTLKQLILLRYLIS
jgi:hypothetical protein